MTTLQDAACAAPVGPMVEFRVHFRAGNRGRRRLRHGREPGPPAVEAGRIPRISRLMALAIRYDQLIRQGVIEDYADLARLGGVSKTRVSQVMALLDLCPTIQEELLHLPRTLHGRDRVTERMLRSIVAVTDWERQRQRWCIVVYKAAERDDHRHTSFCDSRVFHSKTLGMQRVQEELYNRCSVTP